MPDKSSTKGTRAAGQALADRMAGLAAPPAESAPGPAERPARQRAARSRAASAPMPAEQPKPDRYEKRFSLTITPEQWQALYAARGADGVEGTYRIRAMIALWMDDDRLRGRIDRLARAESHRDKQSRGYR